MYKHWLFFLDKRTCPYLSAKSFIWVISCLNLHFSIANILTSKSFVSASPSFFLSLCFRALRFSITYIFTSKSIICLSVSYFLSIFASGLYVSLKLASFLLLKASSTSLFLSLSLCFRALHHLHLSSHLRGPLVFTTSVIQCDRFMRHMQHRRWILTTSKLDKVQKVLTWVYLIGVPP